MGTTLLQRMLAPVHSWCRSILRRERLESDMDAELSYHLQERTADLVRGGYSQEEAERRARLEFGSAILHKEKMRASLGLRWADELIDDLRYAMRLLTRSPGFTAIAALSLALAIGANTTIFSIMKLVLFDQLSVPRASELKLLHWHGDKHTVVSNMWGIPDNVPGGIGGASFSYPAYERLRQDNVLLQPLFAFKDVGRMNVTINGTARVLQGELVSGNFFDQMEVVPQLGRPIEPVDDRTEAPSVVAVISAGLWRSTFASSRTVVGRVIKVNMVPVTIIGVASAGFTGAMSVQSCPDLFLPLRAQPLVEPRGKNGSMLDQSSPNIWWLNIMGRLKPGSSEALAEASLDRSLSTLVRFSLKPGSNDTIPKLTVKDGSRGLFLSKELFGKPVVALMAVVALVLLLACANIASLLLARSAARQREISVRLALGAGRARILRGVLTECLMLSTLGGLIGLALAVSGCSVIPKLLANPWEAAEFSIPLDWGVFAFTAAVTLLTGLLFGTVPAWTATRTEVGTCLKSTAPTITRQRHGLGGKAIVGLQMMLSTMLVVGALLFLRTLWNLAHVDPGFRSDHLVLFAIQQPELCYPPPKDIALHQRIEERLRNLPGVEAVTLSEVGYISDSRENTNFLPEGRKPDPDEEESAWNNAVGADFFRTMGVPILAGRDFTESDTATSRRVGILSESLARKAFPGQNPIGRHFLAHFHPGEGKPGDWIEVVGVCGDTRYWNLKEDPGGMFYEPYRQTSNLDYGATYEVRTQLGPDVIAPSLRSAVQSIDPDLPLEDIRTQGEQIDASMQQERIFAALTAAFGFLALLLACVGVYGVMSYATAQRTNEIGVRIALGARPKQILGMVLREATWLSLGGITAGVTGAFLLARSAGALLYGIRPNDPVAFAGAVVFLGAVGVASSWIPAQRAASVDPMRALRHE